MTRLLPLSLCVATALSFAFSQGAPKNGSVVLSPGQTSRIGNTTLTLLGVQDDRCPPHAYCIMAGNVTASVLVSQGGKSRLVKPELFGRPVNLPAGTLKLSHVSRRETGKQPRLTFDLKSGVPPR